MNLPQFKETVDFNDKRLWLIEGENQPASIGVTIDADADFPIAKGTVMGKVTATGRYIPYVDSAIDGSGVAVGLLNETVDEQRISSTNQDVTSTIGIQGTAIVSDCVGLDANARVDMKNISFIE